MALEIRRPGEVWLLLRIVSLAWALPLALRWTDVRTLLAALSRGPRAGLSASGARIDSVDIDRAARWTAGVLRHLPFTVDTCLIRSLILYRLFQSAGLPVRVVFGVRRSGEELLGHSWLEGEMDLPQTLTAGGGFEVVYVYPELGEGAASHADG